MKTVAKTLLFDRDDKILILYRGFTHPRYAHHPDFPGGEVEPGESPIEAVSREIEEETGLVIHSKIINEVLVKKINNRLTHIICMTKLESSEPVINLSWEHESHEWLTLDELRSRKLPTAPDDYYITVLEHTTNNRVELT